MVNNDVPDLVPVRMLNEFTYCARLFYLEWVQAQFVDNADTVTGRWAHRAVDEQSGPVGEPGHEMRPSWSVALSAPGLGLSTRIDRLEDDGDGYVAPVETKRGRPPDNPQRAWDPERVQLCAQGLILQENGYSCRRGYIFFAETRERVVVEFDTDLTRLTRTLIAELRDSAAWSELPLPLVDSPKCPRCSLVGICLPDEVNTLAERTQCEPRRLIPRDSSASPMYAVEQGGWVTKDKGRIVVKKDGQALKSVRSIDVSQLCIYGNVQVSAQLFRELFARDIPICWFSYGGWFSGIATGLPGKNVELRRRQVISSGLGGVDLARRIVYGKIRNSRTLLMRNSKNRPDKVIDQLRKLSDAALGAGSPASLLGVEGTAARLYFSVFQGMFRSDKVLPGSAFTFEGRNRRPPTDAVNCLLGFVYGLLVKELTVTLLAVGFDPYLGFYHKPRFGRPALALDLAEEFRPIVADSVVVNLINNGEVRDADFVVRAGGVSLSAGGRKAVIAAYERRMTSELTHPTFKYRATYRRTLEIQARLLGAYLLGEVPEYTSVMTR